MKNATSLAVGAKAAGTWYVIGRRIDAARRLLLQGAARAYAATAVGFYDQAHLTGHFKRYTATTPAGYARSHTRGPRTQM
jgi:AraC-like DNA-binding protein